MSCHRRLSPRCQTTTRKLSTFATPCPAIENVLQASVPPTLRLLAEKTIRYARRVVVVAFEEDECTTANFLSHERYTKTRHSYERWVRLLRREVVRALRGGNLELRYSRNRGTFRTSARDLRSASGCGRSEVACFVNAVCYAVTREVGAFPFPLITLRSGP